jgi:hypothetical protein
LSEGFDSISEVPLRSTADVTRARVSNASEGMTVVGCLKVMRGDGDVEGRGAVLKRTFDSTKLRAKIAGYIPKAFPLLPSFGSMEPGQYLHSEKEYPL